MNGSRLSQILVFIFSMVMIIIQILGTSTVFNHQIFESVFSQYTGYFVFPVGALINIVYVIMIGLFLSTCTILLKRFSTKEGSVWLRRCSGPVIIGSILYWMTVLLTCYRQFVTAAAIIGICAFVVLIILYARFGIVQPHKLGMIEAGYWQEHYGGWHALTIYLFIILLAVALQESGTDIMFNMVYFVVFDVVFVGIVLVFYSILTQKFLPVLITSAMQVLISYENYGRNKFVGIFTIVLAAILPITLAVLNTIRLAKEDEKEAQPTDYI